MERRQRVHWSKLTNQRDVMGNQMMPIDPCNSSVCEDPIAEIIIDKTAR